MRTPKELLEFCEMILSKNNMSKTEFCRKINASPALFNMAEKRNSYFSVETLCNMSTELNIPLDELLNTKFADKSSLPKDIQKMERMLLEIPEQDREMIELNIKNYYNRSRKN